MDKKLMVVQSVTKLKIPGIKVKALVKEHYKTNIHNKRLAQSEIYHFPSLFSL